MNAVIKGRIITKEEPDDSTLVPQLLLDVQLFTSRASAIPIMAEPKSQIPIAKDLASLVSKNGYFLFETTRGIVAITYKLNDMAQLRKRLKNDSGPLFFSVTFIMLL